MNKNRKISVSAIRRANENLVNRSEISKRFNVVSSNVGDVSFKTVYMGRNYEINISQNEIKDAFAKSLKETISI